MVFVHRADTYEGKYVSQRKIVKLLEKILESYKQKNIPDEPIAIKVNPKIYDSYVGHYEIDPYFIISVFKENNQFMARISNPNIYHHSYKIYPKSEMEYFFNESNAQLIFVKNKDHKITHLVYSQKGDRIAKKMESRQAINLDPETLNLYCGKYELDGAPGYIINIKNKNNKLFIDTPNGDDIFRIYPESESLFFTKEINATISFVKTNNKISHATISYGKEHLIKKIE